MLPACPSSWNHHWASLGSPIDSSEHLALLRLGLLNQVTDHDIRWRSIVGCGLFLHRVSVDGLVGNLPEVHALTVDDEATAILLRVLVAERQTFRTPLIRVPRRNYYAIRWFGHVVQIIFVVLVLLILGIGVMVQ